MIYTALPDIIPFNIVSEKNRSYTWKMSSEALEKLKITPSNCSPRSSIYLLWFATCWPGILKKGNLKVPNFSSNISFWILERERTHISHQFRADKRIKGFSHSLHIWCLLSCSFEGILTPGMQSKWITLRRCNNNFEDVRLS